MKQHITYDRLRELLDYDPDTGVFRWTQAASLENGGNRRPWGNEAGTIDVHGYRMITLDRKRMKAHRLAWLYVTGEWPSRNLDHIDRNRLDNTFGNLRLASHFQNVGNAPKYRTNTSGYKGVCHFRGRWRASCGGKYLGDFPTKEEAAHSYDAAAIEHFGEFSCLNFPRNR